MPSSGRVPLSATAYPSAICRIVCMMVAAHRWLDVWADAARCMLRVPCARTAGRPIQLLSSVVKWLRVGVELQYCYSRARCSTRQQWSPARLASAAPECRMRWLAQVEAPDADEASEFSPEEDFEDEALDADDEELYGDRLRRRGCTRGSARRS